MVDAEDLVLVEILVQQPIEGMRRAINAAYEEAGIEFVRPESGLYS